MNSQTFVKELAYMYLDGMSLREIASAVNLSHITVRKYLLEDLFTYDSELYQSVILEIKNKTPKSIDNPDVRARVIRAYYKLVREDKTIEEIAKEENAGYFTIQRDLSVRLPKLQKIMPDIVTEEMISTVNEILERHSNNNLINQR